MEGFMGRTRRDAIFLRVVAGGGAEGRGGVW